MLLSRRNFSRKMPPFSIMAIREVESFGAKKITRHSEKAAPIIQAATSSVSWSPPKMTFCVFGLSCLLGQ
jgi:hypothetical protein